MQSIYFSPTPTNTDSASKIPRPFLEINNVVLVSRCEQSDSVIHVLFKKFFSHFRKFPIYYRILIMLPVLQHVFSLEV